MYGPKNPFAQELHNEKYRNPGETFDDACVRYARTVKENDAHFRILLDGLRHQRILPAGRQQLAVGSGFGVTAMNCYVGGDIPDSMVGIFDEVKDGALTLRTGGGMGWNFSTLRPQGDTIHGLGKKSYSSGPISFMNVWQAMCGTILSAGHRRGAMMGVLDVTHPDIMRFINAKQDQGTLSNFNISVAVTDQFMEAVANDGLYDLQFNGRKYGTMRALDIWSTMMERNWDWAEPGVLFMERINRWNNLWYCEKISATNPCGEVPLPPYGACLLMSINCAQFIRYDDNGLWFDFDQLNIDVDAGVRANDRVIDISHYPLERQKTEHAKKRRMGMGVTGIANAIETVWGHKYGTKEYIEKQEKIMEAIQLQSYRTSIAMAAEKGPFELYDRDMFLKGHHIKDLPEDIIWGIKKYGIRNSHLGSQAPTGTISMAADNVSGGIEPVFAHRQSRLVHMPEGQREIQVNDYAFENYGVKGRTSDETTAEEHVDVLCSVQKYIDQAVSKTCNVDGKKPTGEGTVSFERFKDLYMRAYEGGAKGCTTFNKNGKRFGILKEVKDEVEEGAACTFDPETGTRTCE